jgi:hypothetical protein
VPSDAELQERTAQLGPQVRLELSAPAWSYDLEAESAQAAEKPGWSMLSEKAEEAGPKEAESARWRAWHQLEGAIHLKLG